MKSSKFLLSTTVAATVIGAVALAYAQTTPDASSGSTAATPAPNPGTMPAPPRDSTLPGATGATDSTSSTPPAAAGTAAPTSDATSAPASGGTAGNATDAPKDGSSMATERPPQADRN